MLGCTFLCLQCKEIGYQDEDSYEFLGPHTLCDECRDADEAE